ncbi:MAG: LLM class flavin-dependent oxidoreductase [Chloroflexi bacterium]|nr:LLM class flavin-dependent oxidoreductase [Chloroflexota bacterium]
MSVRVGLTISRWPFPKVDPEQFYECVDRAEALGLDAVWIPDNLKVHMNIEPVVSMAVAAARTRRIKLGTSVMVAPVRNPVLLAREMATLDFFSGGRTVLGLGLGRAGDMREYGVSGGRGERVDELIQVMRKLWSEPAVSFQGKSLTIQGMGLFPRPVQKPGIPIWLGGTTEPALRRAARLGDGWMALYGTPEETRRQVQQVQRYAAEHGRRIPPENISIYLLTCFGKDPDEASKLIRPYLLSERRDAPVSAYCAVGTPQQVVAKLREYVAAGISTFIIRPSCPPEQFMAQVELLGREVAPAV